MNKRNFQIKKIGENFYKVVTLKNSQGKILDYVTTPIMVKLKIRDILQIIIGASILAIPVGLTEECWVLGEVLPLANVLLLALITITFIAGFVYFNFYRDMLKDHTDEYIKRVLATYLLSLLVVGIFLTLIDKTPWSTAPMIAIKRMVIAAFPCSMSATVSDVIK